MRLTKNTTYWYKWLSIVGFGILSHRIVVEIYYKQKDYNLYFALLFRMALIIILLIILPPTVLSIVIELIVKNTGFEWIQYLELVYLYIAGVISTDKLYKWAVVNVSDF